MKIDPSCAFFERPEFISLVDRLKIGEFFLLKVNLIYYENDPIVVKYYLFQKTRFIDHFGYDKSTYEKHKSFYISCYTRCFNPNREFFGVKGYSSLNCRLINRICHKKHIDQTKLPMLEFTYDDRDIVVCKDGSICIR